MNTKKILAIFVGMLVLALIPAAAGATVEQPETETSDEMGVTMLYGWITKPQLVNGYVTFKCIFVHYYTRGFGEAQSGRLNLFQELQLSGSFIGFIGNHYILGRFNGKLI